MVVQSRNSARRRARLSDS